MIDKGNEPTPIGCFKDDVMKERDLKDILGKDLTPE